MVPSILTDSSRAEETSSYNSIHQEISDDDDDESVDGEGDENDIERLFTPARLKQLAVSTYGLSSSSCFDGTH